MSGHDHEMTLAEKLARAAELATEIEALDLPGNLSLSGLGGRLDVGCRQCTPDGVADFLALAGRADGLVQRAEARWRERDPSPEPPAPLWPGRVFLSGGRPYLLADWGGSQWVFWWHPGHRWVTLREATAADKSRPTLRPEHALVYGVCTPVDEGGAA